MNWRKPFQRALITAFVVILISAMAGPPLYYQCSPEVWQRCVAAYVRWQGPLTAWTEQLVAQLFIPHCQWWWLGRALNFAACCLAAAVNAGLLVFALSALGQWVSGDGADQDQAWFEHALVGWLKGDRFRPSHKKDPVSQKRRDRAIAALWELLERPEPDWHELVAARKAVFTRWRWDAEDPELLGALGLATYLLDQMSGADADAEAAGFSERCLGAAWDLGLRRASFLKPCLALDLRGEDRLAAMEEALRQDLPQDPILEWRALKKEGKAGGDLASLLERAQKARPTTVELQVLQAEWLEALGQPLAANELWDKILLRRPSQRAFWQQALQAAQAQGDQERVSKLQARQRAKQVQRPPSSTWLYQGEEPWPRTPEQRVMLCLATLALVGLLAAAVAGLRTPKEPMQAGRLYCSAWIRLNRTVMAMDDVPWEVESFDAKETDEWMEFTGFRKYFVLDLDPDGRARFSKGFYLSLNWRPEGQGIQLTRLDGSPWGEVRVAEDGLELRPEGWITSFLFQTEEHAPFKDRDLRWYAAPKAVIAPSGIFIPDVDGNLVKISRYPQKFGFFSACNSDPDERMIADFADPMTEQEMDEAGYSKYGKSLKPVVYHCGRESKSGIFHQTPAGLIVEKPYVGDEHEYCAAEPPVLASGRDAFEDAGVLELP